jgi:hypothetical protein
MGDAPVTVEHLHRPLLENVEPAGGVPLLQNHLARIAVLDRQPG